MKNETFEQVMATKSLDLCAIFAGRSKAPFFLEIILEALRKSHPGFVHKCPHIGLSEANNITLPRQFITLYPTGEFKLLLLVADGRKELLTYEQVFVFL
jgi:hypothetical protein